MWCYDRGKRGNLHADRLSRGLRGSSGTSLCHLFLGRPAVYHRLWPRHRGGSTADDLLRSEAHRADHAAPGLLCQFLPGPLCAAHGESQACLLALPRRARRPAARLLGLRPRLERDAQGLHQRHRALLARHDAGLSPAHPRAPAQFVDHGHLLGLHVHHGGHGRSAVSHLPGPQQDDGRGHAGDLLRILLPLQCDFPDEL